MALIILHPFGVRTNCVDIMPRASNDFPFKIPGLEYVLKRWATVPNASVISATATSLNRVNSPRLTNHCRGSTNWTMLAISGAGPLFLISNPLSIKSL